MNLTIEQMREIVRMVRLLVRQITVMKIAKSLIAKRQTTSFTGMISRDAWD